jgi:hypothetical protein
MGEYVIIVVLSHGENRLTLLMQLWKITILRQKVLFFPFAEGGAEIFGVFRVKNHDFTPKSLIFSDCGGRREIFWGISCEKSRFYDKKNHIFSNLIPQNFSRLPPLGAIFLIAPPNLKSWIRPCYTNRKWKNQKLRQISKYTIDKKNHIFSNFRGCARRVRPPWIRPCIVFQFNDANINLLIPY